MFSGSSAFMQFTTLHWQHRQTLSKPICWWLMVMMWFEKHTVGSLNDSDILSTASIKNCSSISSLNGNYADYQYEDQRLKWCCDETVRWSCERNNEINNFIYFPIAWTVNLGCADWINSRYMIQIHGISYQIFILWKFSTKYVCECMNNYKNFQLLNCLMQYSIHESCLMRVCVECFIIQVKVESNSDTSFYTSHSYVLCMCWDLRICRCIANIHRNDIFVDTPFCSEKRNPSNTEERNSHRGLQTRIQERFEKIIAKSTRIFLDTVYLDDFEQHLG